MRWLISEYWLWLLFAALLGAVASAAFTLRKVEVHTPPASGGAAPAPVEQSAAEEAEEHEEHEEYDDRSFAPPTEEEQEPGTEPEPEPGPEPEPTEFGPGSAAPLPDGGPPSEQFTIKANATSMVFHTPESPYYGRTHPEVWFDSEESARAAGFARWDDED